MTPKPLQWTPSRAALSRTLLAALLFAPAAAIGLHHQSPAWGQVSVPPPEYICKSSSFGTYGTILSRNANRLNCVDAPPLTRPTQTEVFWIPTRYRPAYPSPPSLVAGRCSNDPSRNVLTQNITASMNESTAIQALTLVNIDSSRKLTVVGTSRGDVLIGSPASSDILNGGLGANTYVTGGLEAVLLGSGDRSVSLSPTAESDRVELGPDAELIHIGSTLQNAPGQLENAAGSLVTVRGADSVQSYLPSSNDCVAAAPFSAYAPPVVYESLALSTASHPSRPPVAPALPLQLAQNRTTTGHRRSANPEDIPGVPSLIGFTAEGSKRDRIYIPAKGFTFEGRPITDRFPRGAAIPIYLVNDIQYEGGKVVRPQELARLARKAQGLSKVRSDTAPLVYFRSSGLLVFSMNSQPLGSRRNPGRVIARLLDVKGRPLKLDSASGPTYLARFIAFQAPTTNRGGTAGDQRPPGSLRIER